MDMGLAALICAFGIGLFSGIYGVRVYLSGETAKIIASLHFYCIAAWFALSKIPGVWKERAIGGNMRITYILMALALAFSTASTADEKLNHLKSFSPLAYQAAKLAASDIGIKYTGENLILVLESPEYFNRLEELHKLEMKSRRKKMIDLQKRDDAIKSIYPQYILPTDFTG